MSVSRQCGFSIHTCPGRAGSSDPSADDLHSVALNPLEGFDHGRGKLDGRLFPRHVARLGVPDQPVSVTIKPGIHTVVQDDVERARGNVWGQHVLFDDGQIGIDEDPAVEAGDR